MARPRKNIDPEQVRKLAGLGLTQKDIASFVGWSQSLVSLRFSSSYDLGVTQSKTPIFAAAQFAVLERAQRLALKARDLCRPFVYRLLPFSHPFSWVFRPVFPWF